MLMIETDRSTESHRHDPVGSGWPTVFHTDGIAQVQSITRLWAPRWTNTRSFQISCEQCGARSTTCPTRGPRRDLLKQVRRHQRLDREVFPPPPPPLWAESICAAAAVQRCVCRTNRARHSKKQWPRLRKLARQDRQLDDFFRPMRNLLLMGSHIV